MNKVWKGYLSSVLFLLAGLMMIIGERPVLGIVFILLAIASVILWMYMGKNQGK